MHVADWGQALLIVACVPLMMSNKGRLYALPWFTFTLKMLPHIPS